MLSTKTEPARKLKPIFLQRSHLHGICMPRGDFCTRTSSPASHDAVMDVLAIVLGVVMFAVLLALVFGIDAI